MTTVTDSNVQTPSDESQRPSNQPRRSVSNLAVRIMTGLVLLPAVIFVTFVGGWWLTIVALALTVIGTIEFYHMEQQRGLPGNTLLGLVTAVVVVLAFHFQVRELWMLALAFIIVASLVLEWFRSHDINRSLLRTLTTLGGILYIAFPTGFFIAIRSSHPDGIQWLYALLFATWGTDSFAYLAGRAFGKTPLAPHLSPSKTVEGAIGGVLAGIFFSSLVLIQAQLLDVGAFILLVIAPITAIVGDLFESAIKRYFRVKDSGVVGLNPFPGHGGVLDRIDAMLLVTVLFYGYLLLYGLVWL